ncbi:c-type cytochrome biogenesis protein CcmI [Phaeobacter sp. HF9A]|uniref:c-type cytochrome biogenesis protein CcmI n=1 Tax=Phaeobacter sp. HF9A TaxID=2721561 RepID=UPI00142F4D92|nr:c-type cytochrome biogenesis protein CcmI [Phaeobacter sp. HF9A]NIZ14352.1 c-type cytochrome biogenesis protein CcmI [Phaeobacter sp. HF9A]
MAFWILTGFVTLGIAGVLAMVLLRNKNGAAEPAAAYDLRVYRQQLKDLDRDVARGTVAAEDAERLRTEISRRILAADAQVQGAVPGNGVRNGPSRVGALIVALVVIGGTGMLYLDLGAPGYGDFGLERRIALAAERAATRPTQAEAEAQTPPAPKPDADPAYVKLVEELRSATADRPEDPQGQALLVQHEARLGNFKAAYAAKARYVALRGEEVRAADLVDLAELQIMAAGGYVSPEAEDALVQALEKSPQDGRARYYLGLMMGQIGRPDRGFQLWSETLRDGPSDALWVRAILAQMPEMAALAGAPVASLPGPSAADVAAVEDMNPEDRQQMIEGMVARLSDRLATEGGSAEEWVRLITALGVLGRLEDAREIHAEARQKFAADPATLDALDAAMKQAEARQ